MSDIYTRAELNEPHLVEDLHKKIWNFNLQFQPWSHVAKRGISLRQGHSCESEKKRWERKTDIIV